MALDGYGLLNIICAVAGLCLFLYCIRVVRQILSLFPNAKMNKSWKIVILLIAFFAIGYIVNIMGVIMSWNEVLLVMQSFVYLFGAVFVLIVVRLSQRTYKVILESAQKKE